MHNGRVATKENSIRRIFRLARPQMEHTMHEGGQESGGVDARPESLHAAARTDVSHAAQLDRGPLSRGTGRTPSLDRHSRICPSALGRIFEHGIGGDLSPCSARLPTGLHGHDNPKNPAPHPYPDGLPAAAR